MPTVSALGALIALIVAIFLILKKFSPAYGMSVSYTHRDVYKRQPIYIKSIER